MTYATRAQRNQNLVAFYWLLVPVDVKLRSDIQPLKSLEKCIGDAFRFLLND